MSQHGTTKPRLSLTKRQRADGAGAELLALLQQFTADGTLSVEEIDALKSWLDANRDAALPSVQFLAEAVERVLVDGVVTDEERRELYRGVEAVLPPDARAEAVARRREAARASFRPRACQTEGCGNLLPDEAGANRKWCDSCREVRAAPNTLRDGDVPGFKLGFKVAGVSFDGRQEIIRDGLRDGDPLMLVRNAANPYDANAIEVRLTTGEHIGHVPRPPAEVQSRYEDCGERTNADLARLLDLGCGHQAEVWKVLTGGKFLGVFAIGRVDSYLAPHPARGIFTEPPAAVGRVVPPACERGADAPEAPPPIPGSLVPALTQPVMPTTIATGAASNPVEGGRPDPRSSVRLLPALALAAAAVVAAALWLVR